MKQNKLLYKTAFNKPINKDIIIPRFSIKMLTYISVLILTGLCLVNLVFNVLWLSQHVTDGWKIYVLNIVTPIWVAIYLVYILLLKRPNLITHRLWSFWILTYLTLNILIWIFVHVRITIDSKSLQSDS